MAHTRGEDIYGGTIAEDLLASARNAARVCLGATAGEVATLITDDGSREGTAAIARELVDVGVDVEAYVLEEMGRRPISAVPMELQGRLERSQISVYWSIPLPGELKSRLQILNIVSEKLVRHAHIIGLSREQFVEGLKVDYRTVRDLQERIIGRLGGASEIRCVTPGGTDLAAPLPMETDWVSLSGIIEPGKWQNLPSGQVMGVPLDANGTFVADAAIGEWFGPRYRDLSEYPLSLEIENGRCRDAHSPNQRLAREFLLYIRSNTNSDRIGELSLGTNLGLGRFTGNALIDENVPGLHIALGDPLPELTGASWSSKTHVPLIGRSASIYLDHVPLMEDGLYAQELLG
jgi:hypothetical protein